MSDRAKTSPTVELGRLGQIGMTAHDIDRAEGFYRDVLGMRFLFRAGDLVFFDCEGVRLMLSQPESPDLDHAGSILYFIAADIHATFRALTDLGVQFIDEPHLVARMPDHELWMAFFRDSEDNTLALMSEIPSA